MISRRLWSALRRLASSLWEGYVEVGPAVFWVDLMMPYTYARKREGRPSGARAAAGQDEGLRYIPAKLSGPPPGHPERLVGESRLTPLEARLWRELQEEL